MRSNKYGAKTVEADGYRFASKKEYKRYFELKLLEQAGEISNLDTQPRIALQGVGGAPLLSDGNRRLFYVADFRYWDCRAQKWVLEDVKSEATRTPVYKLKKAILRAMGMEVTET